MTMVGLTLLVLLPLRTCQHWEHLSRKQSASRMLFLQCLATTVVYFTYEERGLEIPSNILDWSRTILPTELFEAYRLWVGVEIPNMIVAQMQYSKDPSTEQ